MSKQESNLCVDDKSATETTEPSHKKSLGCCGGYGRTVAHSLFRKKHFKDIFHNDLNKTLTTISLILYGLGKFLVNILKFCLLIYFKILIALRRHITLMKSAV